MKPDKLLDLFGIIVFCSWLSNLSVAGYPICQLQCPCWAATWDLLPPAGQCCLLCMLAHLSGVVAMLDLQSFLMVDCDCHDVTSCSFSLCVPVKWKVRQTEQFCIGFPSFPSANTIQGSVLSPLETHVRVAVRVHIKTKWNGSSSVTLYVLNFAPACVKQVCGYMYT